MSTLTLKWITEFHVAAELVRETESSLKKAGREGYELFVLWSGLTDGSVFRVQDAHIPHQTSYRLESGLCVRVEGEALHKLNNWLFESGQLLAVQIHAHPTDAYHSDTDDAFPVVTMLGGLSLVVPDFCLLGLFEGSVGYRLAQHGWIRDPREPEAFIKVI